MEAPYDRALECVKDFYAILRTFLWDNPYSIICIWGVNALIDVSIINNVLGVPNVFDAKYLANARDLDMH